MGYWQCKACTYDGDRFIVRCESYDFYMVGFDGNGGWVSATSETPEWFVNKYEDDLKINLGKSTEKSIPFACPICRIIGSENFKWISKESDLITFK